MNDPHGIVWDGKRYHMFFQYLPTSLKWESNLDWGHAVSDDLVVWTQIESALTPQQEVGCWSGSAVAVENGFLLYYTRPTMGDWSKGQVVVVQTDKELTTFERIEPPVITEAPEEHFYDFRDPQVRREGDTYVMTIGAGIRDYGGCALQFRSTDALHWEFESILASRPQSEMTPIATGNVWECPQFFKLGRTWCLLISSMHSDTYQQVQYALGNYDGTTFYPETWGNLGYSDIPYATSTFQDNQGRTCMMSWLRESGEVEHYAGAQSVPILMNEVDGALEVEVHPNVQQHFSVTSESHISSSSWISLKWTSAEFDLSLSSDDTSMRIGIENSRVTLTINHEIRVFDVPRAGSRAEILIDADILELLLPECPMTLALRIPIRQRWAVSYVGEAEMTLKNYLG